MNELEGPELTAAELSVLSDHAFFHLKAETDAKVKALFRDARVRVEAQTERWRTDIPEEILRLPIRWFRGENYHGFPWRAFDFPRSYVETDIFTFRVLLLWGNHFSLHLLLTGKWMRKYLPTLKNATRFLGEADIWLSYQESPWQWEFDATTHRPLSGLWPEDFEAAVKERGFLKLSRRLPLAAYAELPAAAAATWEAMLTALYGPPTD